MSRWSVEKNKEQATRDDGISINRTDIKNRGAGRPVFSVTGIRGEILLEADNLLQAIEIVDEQFAHRLA